MDDQQYTTSQPQVGPQSDSTLSLHPNLARIAVRYQEIFERCSRGELDVLSANRQISNLVAYDDQGIRWSINPADGGWMYRSRNGAWVPATPPTWGLATLTAHDVTDHAVAGNGTSKANPDHSIRFRRVDPDALNGADSLRGAAARAARSTHRPAPTRPRWLFPAAAVVAAVLLVIGATKVFGSDEEAPERQPGPTMVVR